MEIKIEKINVLEEVQVVVKLGIVDIEVGILIHEVYYEQLEKEVIVGLYMIILVLILHHKRDFEIDNFEINSQEEQKDKKDEERDSINYVKGRENIDIRTVLDI